MEITKEKMKLFFDKADGVVCKLFPGLFVLDLCFSKGIFSSSIESVYEFLILLIWAYVLGLPFEFFVPKRMNNIVDEFGNIGSKRYGNNKRINELIANDDYFKDISYSFKLFYFIPKMIVFYVSYKLLSVINLPIIDKIAVFDKNIINVVITYFVSDLFGIPIGHIYVVYARFKIKKAFGRIDKKHNEEKTET